MKKSVVFCLAIYALTFYAVPIFAENAYPDSAEKTAIPQSSDLALKADFVDKDIKAKAQSATVKVDVQGIQIIDPAEVNEIAAPSQGHLHYQVDNGPVIATTAKKLSFHGLTKGSHTIQVVLAGNDHKPLGPQQTLSVDIP